MINLERELENIENEDDTEMIDCPACKGTRLWGKEEEDCPYCEDGQVTLDSLDRDIFVPERDMLQPESD